MGKTKKSKTLKIALILMEEKFPGMEWHWLDNFWRKRLLSLARKILREMKQ